MITDLDRRQFLHRGFAALGATWTAAHWPAVVAAAEHSRHFAASGAPYKFEFLTSAEAIEVAALAARIIPSDGTPGATEAGVVYFIDRALVTFSSEDQKTYRTGIPEIQKRTRELFPGVALYSAATADQQDAVLESLDEAGAKSVSRRPRGGFLPGSGAQTLFEVLRMHTIAGFLIDPESDRRGNKGGVGWAVIGRDTAHGFEPPFGFYDKGYAGWQAVPVGKAAAKFAPSDFAPATSSPDSFEKDGSSK